MCFGVHGDFVDWKRKFMPIKSLDWAIVQRQNMAVCDFKCAKIAQIQDL